MQPRNESVLAMKITVVIPYYQREAGLLGRAVQSIIDQDIAQGWAIDVVVVDDESPMPARDEVFGAFPTHVNLRIVEQKNTGVGGARNTGLDAADPDTRFIAFLDSDDSWAPKHLMTAVNELESGADFYFDNNIIDEGFDAFSHSDFMKNTHGALDVAEPFVGIMDGATGFDAILHECLPHTSQVVYDFDKNKNVRFETTLKRAGEDQIFWLTLASRSSRIAYSTAINGWRGVGVSIYRESLAWDSPNGLSRVADEISMRTAISRRFNLGRPQLRLLRSDAQMVCNHFVFLAVRNARKQPRELMGALLRLTRESPSFWMMVPHSLMTLPRYVRDLRRSDIRPANLP